MKNKKAAKGIQAESVTRSSSTHDSELISGLVDEMEDGFGVWDADGKLIAFNGLYREVLSAFPIVEIGMTFFDGALGLAKTGNVKEAVGSEEKWAKEKYEAFKSGLGKESEYQTHDGRWIFAVDRAMKNGGILSIRKDVTDLKNREMALTEKSGDLALASAALNKLPVAVLIKDEDLKYRLVNEQFSQYLGKSADALIGKTTAESVGEERAKEYDARELEVIKTGEAIEYEETFAGANGEQISSLTSITRVDDGNGNQFACVVVNDVSELLAREEKLKIQSAEIELSNERFKAFAETNSDWFWEMDSDLRFSYFSESFENVTGVSPQRLLGKNRQETGIPGISQNEFEAHLSVLENHEPFRDFIHSRQANDGSEIWLAISGTPIFDASGKFQGYQGSGRDVTGQVTATRELEKARIASQTADRAKSEFLANMSHEIRTPMNGVMGMAELLAKTELSAKQKMFTDVIVKSGASLLTIINDILDFSKLEAGQMELDIAPFSLAEAIEDVATLVSSRVVEKDLELIVRVDPELPDRMIGDVGRIRQIITNLMGNAVKFTETGHVYVNVHPVRDSRACENKLRLRFEVEDTGIGIPEEKCNSVFEKFSQVDTSSSRKHEGTGLGLTICSSLVEIMGGEIGVKSKEGEGSTFWFEIEMEADLQKSMRQRVPMDVTGARILIVDDNSVNRSILSEQMAAWQFDSAAAVDGSEALAVMRAAGKEGINIDCVVLDYHMPGMNGGDVVKTMRADERLAGIPVVMLTSVDQTEDGKVFSSLGIQAHLTKPARSSFLLETIVEILEQNSFDNQENKISSLIAPEPVYELEADLGPEVEIADGNVDKNELEAGRVPLVDILVCEDNQVNQIVFTQILEATDYSFKIASNGKIGVDMAMKYNPRVILMDVSMPEMNGLEATGAIRKYQKEAGLYSPIIGVTAHAIKGDMEKCIEAGMDDYLAKPISPDALEIKVDHWMESVKAVKSG